MSDLDIKVIKEYLEDCAISDNFHYEQYQIELLLNAYDKKNKEIKRLNNTINKLQKSWREEIKQEIYRTLDIVRSDKE